MKLLDRIAKRLGYIPRAGVPRIEVDYGGGIDGRPTYILIEPAGGWMNRVVGYVFPALDDQGRGVSPFRGPLLCPPNPLIPTRDEADPA